MSLTTLQVYSKSLYQMFTERQDQAINAFNGASGGCVRLIPMQVQGDFLTTAHYGLIPDIVRRRNPYANGAIPQRELKMLEDIAVKVAAGTQEMRIDPSQWRWIQQNPAVAGATIGAQLADQSMKDMLNTALGCAVAAYSGQPDIVLDVSTETDAAKARASFANLALAAGKMGDRSGSIRAWIMHSTPRTNMLVNNLQNGEHLFTFDTVNVYRDSEGRTFIITDAPPLTDADGVFHLLGLKPGAITVGRNDDWDETTVDKTGQENIVRTYQAEWSYNLSLDGYAWDKVSGGKAPTDAALFNSANWDRYTTSHKDLGGVLLTVKETQ